MSVTPSVMPPGSYKGKTVLITGGGTGLGFACALKFASLGANVVISGRRAAVLEEARKKIVAAGAPKALAVSMDVRKPAAVAETIDRIVAEFGAPPCVVLNNAAGNIAAPSERLSPNAWKTVIDIVLMGTIHVTTEVAKRWIALREEGQKAPQVVFMQVGASYVERGSAFVAPSAAAKAAVLNLTQSLAIEWGKYNMRFWMVSPGPIYTKGAFDRLDPQGKMLRPDRVIPLQRLGTTEEYANLVAYGCSDAASWLSGTNIYFDGGSAAGGGEFQAMRQIPMATWDAMEKKARENNAASKRSKL